MMMCWIMFYYCCYYEDVLQGYRWFFLEQCGVYMMLLDFIYDNGGLIDNNDCWFVGEFCVSICKVCVLIFELLMLQKIYFMLDGKIFNYWVEKEIGNVLEIS